MNFGPTTNSVFKRSEPQEKDMNGIYGLSGPSKSSYPQVADALLILPQGTQPCSRHSSWGSHPDGTAGTLLGTMLEDLFPSNCTSSLDLTEMELLELLQTQNNSASKERA